MAAILSRKVSANSQDIVRQNDDYGCDPHIYGTGFYGLKLAFSVNYFYAWSKDVQWPTEREPPDEYRPHPSQPLRVIHVKLVSHVISTWNNIAVILHKRQWPPTPRPPQSMTRFVGIIVPNMVADGLETQLASASVATAMTLYAKNSSVSTGEGLN